MHINEYKAAVGKFPTGVTIVSTNFSGKLLGFTANSFTSVSLEPPIISFCIDKKAGSLQGFQESTHFAISILAHDQKGISEHFASKINNKFENIDYFIANKSGCPIPDGVVSFIECTTANIFECGDHYIFIGQVVGVKLCNDKDPLIYFGRSYHVCSEKL